MLARSPQIAAGESSRRQKPWARKLLASMRVTNVSVAAMQVTTSVNPTSPCAVMSPSAVSGSLKSACFDRAAAVEGSLETRVHPRWDRGEPCAPKVVFAPACWGHGSSAVRGGHINKPAVGGRRGVVGRVRTCVRSGSTRGQRPLAKPRPPSCPSVTIPRASGDGLPWNRCGLARRDPRVRAGQGAATD
jgi:hypothetical protein